MDDWMQPVSRGELPRREAMQTLEEVAAMLRLKALGWGVRRIAGELGCSHMTVRRYLAEGGWVAYRGRGRRRTLSGLEDWVAERFRRHAGNADVVRQELEREKGIRLSLRTIEREVRHLRRELEVEARATIRFETPPGRQLQIDFGERRVTIGDETVKVYLFVATLGYSRRLYVRAFRNERQESWFAGVEGAFRHFGGITEEVLLDNDRGLVARHDRATREVEFNARLRAFAKHWGFCPHACAPYRARTKGKDERGVGYVKKNAIAGRRLTTSPRLLSGCPLAGTLRNLGSLAYASANGMPSVEHIAWTPGSATGSGLSFARIAFKVRMRGESGKRSPSMILSSSLSRAAVSSSDGSRFIPRTWIINQWLRVRPETGSSKGALTKLGNLSQGMRDEQDRH
jgi:transposase